MSVHQSVLAEEVVRGLRLSPGHVVVDGTFGGGGHTRLLAAAVAPTGRVIGVDRDPAAVAAGRTWAVPPSIELIVGSYADLREHLAAFRIDAVDGILLDLGLSSDQLADRERGFSFSQGGPLDMRFDPSAGVPAWQWLEHVPERALADAIFQYGEERFSRRIARAMVQRRQSRPIRTADELAEVVRRCVPRSRSSSIDPATRTFQALRIVVNRELEHLTAAMDRLPECLKPGGRLAVISFHSLEDRIVKHTLRARCDGTVVTRRPIRPGDAEIAENPRARSARLRIFEKHGATTREDDAARGGRHG